MINPSTHSSGLNNSTIRLDDPVKSFFSLYFFNHRSCLKELFTYSRSELKSVILITEAKHFRHLARAARKKLWGAQASSSGWGRAAIWHHHNPVTTTKTFHKTHHRKHDFSENTNTTNPRHIFFRKCNKKIENKCFFSFQKICFLSCCFLKCQSLSDGVLYVYGPLGKTATEPTVSYQLHSSTWLLSKGLLHVLPLCIGMNNIFCSH